LQAAVSGEAAKAVQGQQQVLERMLICLLSRGHVLLEGVPGIAKTLLAKTLAATVGADFKRIQFTPDLMPSDITGTNVFDMNAGRFELRRGPVCTQMLPAGAREAVVWQAALAEGVAAIEGVKVRDAVLGYIVRLVRASRQAHGVIRGGSPRAELALLRCGKTLAALRGRDYMIPDDVKELA